MADEPTGAGENIRESDIVFDCPHCSKSLAIDYRGAGLFIICPDCGNRLQVPIPEGMDISDFDSTEAEQELKLIQLREAMAEAERQNAELSAEVQDLKQRRDRLERFRVDQVRRFDELAMDIRTLEKTLGRMAELVQHASESFHDTAP